MDVWLSRTGEAPREVAYRLLRRAGAALRGGPESGYAVGREPSGRPTLHAPGGAEVYVSVSHTAGCVTVAATVDGPVGVDVEASRELPVWPLARRWYDPAELDWLEAAPTGALTARFLALWTAKEAVGKALGLGLRRDGLRRRMPLPEGPGPHPLPVTPGPHPLPDQPGLWVWHPAADGLVLAVAAAAPVEVRCHDTALRSAAGSRTTLPVVVRGS